MVATIERGENIRQEEFGALLSHAFALYGLSVVTDRALPDARDGLKPVQRRILYGMYFRRYLSSRPTVKSAEVVGNILGDYHPHGDSSVYDAAVRLAQDFTMRYPLIEGQGNFGSIDGDAAAAYRYTEMRLTPLAEALLRDIEKETVPLHPTYKQDPRVLEPDYLPGRLPPVINPTAGIAVGLSTNIPPHNLREVLTACIALLDDPEMSVHQFMRYVKGPDYPSGGTVVGEEGIREYLATGKGRVIVRGTVRLEDSPRQRSLVITELPPIGKDRLKTTIVNAINARKLEGLVPDVRDESDTEKGIRIVLDLRRDADPAQVVNQLYKRTDLQISQTLQMVFLLGESWEAARQPKQIGMVELLNYWNTHQRDVLTRRTQHDLEKARERLHVVEGLIIGAAHAREIVEIFQRARDRAAAKARIRRRFELSEQQVNVIADMTLSQVTRLDAAKYEDEQRQLRERIAELEALLADESKLIALLKEEMRAIIAEHGDDRRTAIDAAGPVEVAEVAPVVESEPLHLALTHDGRLKAFAPTVYRVPVRGRTPAAARGDEAIAALVPSTTTDDVLLLSSSGKVYGLRAHQIPVGTRVSKGETGRRLVQLEPGEELVGIAALGTHDLYPARHSRENGNPPPRYLVLFSRQGKVKRTLLTEYQNADSRGAVDFRLAPGDAVIAAALAGEDDDCVLLSSAGKVLRFPLAAVRATGRGTRGVAGMALPSKSRLAGATTTPAGAHAKNAVVLLTSAGIAKKVSLRSFPQKGRATVGILGLKLPPGREAAGLAVAAPGSHVIINAAKQVVRLATDDLAAQNRTAIGTQVLPAFDLETVSGTAILVLS